LINRNLLDLDINKNLALRKFTYKVLSQDFEFNKLQLKINNNYFDVSLNLRKTKRKKWK